MALGSDFDLCTLPLQDSNLTTGEGAGSVVHIPANGSEEAMGGSSPPPVPLRVAREQLLKIVAAIKMTDRERAKSPIKTTACIREGPETGPET